MNSTNPKNPKNCLIVISGPSGVGKTTVIELLLKEKLPRLKKLVTCTTRKKRDEEIENMHYFFMSKERFEEAIKNNELLEYEKIYDNYYGTPKHELQQLLNEGHNVIASLGIGGVESVKKLNIPTILIFLKPPSMKEQERRLRTRNIPEHEIKSRLLQASKELLNEELFDTSIENTDLSKTVQKIKEYILSRIK